MLINKKKNELLFKIIQPFLIFLYECDILNASPHHIFLSLSSLMKFFRIENKYTKTRISNKALIFKFKFKKLILASVYSSSRNALPKHIKCSDPYPGRFVKRRKLLFLTVFLGSSVSVATGQGEAGFECLMRWLSFIATINTQHLSESFYFYAASKLVMVMLTTTVLYAVWRETSSWRMNKRIFESQHVREPLTKLALNTILF